MKFVTTRKDTLKQNTPGNQKQTSPMPNSFSKPIKEDRN